MPAYKFATTFKTEWEARCAAEYKAYCKEVKPLLQSVTFLVFSGIFIAKNDKWALYNDEMLSSYAMAFQVHQRPVKTAALHAWAMRRIPYLIYLPLVAMPVDAVVHTYQVFVGEGFHFFEGGLLFPVYLAMHWFLLFCAYLAFFASKCEDGGAAWDVYFSTLRWVLKWNNDGYARTICRERSLADRVFQFTAVATALAGLAVYARRGLSPAPSGAPGLPGGPAAPAFL